MKKGIFGFACIGMVSATALMAASAPAYAQQAEARRDFNIPAQSLASALNEFSRQSDMVVTAPARLTRQRSAPAIRGNYTPREALQALLAGSGLRYRIGRGGSVIVEANSGQTSVQASPNPAAAAENIQDSDNTEIVVTGTNIRGLSNRTQPTTVLTREDIDRRGYSTPEQLFQSVPQNFQAGISSLGALGSGPNAGINNTSATSVNLRGLGPSSTLTLLNGRRLAPTAFGSSVDITMIPLSAIERVEIVTDGSSAIYGSDAVAGVVNIRLRRDFQGAETRVRYGTVTEGSRQERTISQAGGTRWSTGSVFASVQYQDFDALEAGDRSFRGTESPQSQLFPETRNLSFLGSISQQLSSNLTFTGDALLAHREVSRFNIDFADAETESDATIDNLNLAGALEYRPLDDWTATVSLQHSREKSSEIANRVLNNVSDLRPTDQRYGITSVNAVIAGRIVSLPGGALSVGFGGEYRWERFRSEQGGAFPTIRAIQRKVAAAFGELYAPIFSETNSLPFMQALDLSVSARHDDYSDFGATTNYRIGTRYSPLPRLNLRASYSTSFRAPNTSELGSQVNPQGVLIFPLPGPDGTIVPTFRYFGGGNTLLPERAKSLSFGFDYDAPFVEGLRFGVNYYDIRFRDRITAPPIPATVFQDFDTFGPLITEFSSDAEAQAVVDAIRSAGGLVFDFAGGNEGQGVRLAYDGRLGNAAVVRQRGFDAWVDYSVPTSVGDFDFRMNVAHIRSINTAITSTATSDKTVNTFSNPLRWRGRFDLGFRSGAAQFNIAANYSGSYTNDRAIERTPIGSWTTVDIFTRIELARNTQRGLFSGTSLILSVTNLFDQDPPYVQPSVNAGQRYAFDQGNATPLGRVVAMEVRKSW